MSTYKLIYFNITARAETARFMFAVAGQEYEDERLMSITSPNDDRWVSMKKDFPFEQLPVLEIDGEPLSQSWAINRTLARRFNLYGDNETEAAKIDEICEGFVDLGLVCRKYIHEKDKTKQAQLLSALLETEAPKHFRFLTRLLEKNNGGDGFFVGNRLSLADLDAAVYVKDFVPRIPGIQVKEPKLLAHTERILAIPAIADWVKKRPPTTIPGY